MSDDLPRRTVVATIEEANMTQRAQTTLGEANKALERHQRLASSRTASYGAATVATLGSAGIPSGGSLPSVLAINSPLAVFLYTLSRADRINLYNYFHITDQFVGRAIELHAELPLSRLVISKPHGPSQSQNREIEVIYSEMCKRLNLLDTLLEIAREYWSIGDVFIWHQWDEEIQEWDSIYVLPPQYCHVIAHPFHAHKEFVIFARPLVDTSSVRRMTDHDIWRISGSPDFDELLSELEDEIPADLREILDYGEGQPLNTDPDNGSFVVHLSRNKKPGEAYGHGVIERCLEPLLRKENLKNSQLRISSRNMSPKYFFAAESISQNELDELRLEIDLSFLEDADYPVVTNYTVNIQQIGANERLLNVDTEYQQIQTELATGLGTTLELLTGAATYGGQRITLELQNTQYLQFREMMRRYVHDYVFRPVAEAKGHYYTEHVNIWVKVGEGDLEAGDDVIQEDDGTLRRRVVQSHKIYNHAEVRFNRLSIRDSSEVYDQLFQLHQKGSLALDYLLDIHNIDPEENSARLLEDLGTVKDPMFNRLLESLYPGMGELILTTTNLSDRVIEGLNLDRKSQIMDESAPGMGTAGGLDHLGLGGGLGGGLGRPGGLGMPAGGPGGLPGGLPGGPLGDLGPEPGGELPPVGGPPAPVTSAKQRRKEDDLSDYKFPGRRLSSDEVKKRIADRATKNKRRKS